jgi:chorismate mutase
MKNQTDYKLDLQLFAEEDPQDNLEKVDPEKNYAKAIRDLKENTVSKEDYEKLEAQNKQLLDAIINGNGETDDKDKVEVLPSIKELREDLYGGKKHLSNLEYWQKTLALREALMAQGETDPFVPVGERITAERSDFEAAERVATVVKECIDYAKGDSAIFTNELQRRTIDTALPRR